jgi:hypothetical protein
MIWLCVANAIFWTWYIVAVDSKKSSKKPWG